MRPISSPASSPSSRIQSLFPKGNYHVQEINLYFLNLQQNLERRIHAYTTRKSS